MKIISLENPQHARHVHVSIIDKGKIVATGTTDQVRGGKTLQQAFIDLVGAKASGGEGLSWLGSSSR